MTRDQTTTRKKHKQVFLSHKMNFGNHSKKQRVAKCLEPREKIHGAVKRKEMTKIDSDQTSWTSYSFSNAKQQEIQQKIENTRKSKRQKLDLNNDDGCSSNGNSPRTGNDLSFDYSKAELQHSQQLKFQHHFQLPNVQRRKNKSNGTTTRKTVTSPVIFVPAVVKQEQVLQLPYIEQQQQQQLPLVQEEQRVWHPEQHIQVHQFEQQQHQHSSPHQWLQYLQMASCNNKLFGSQHKEPVVEAVTPVMQFNSPNSKAIHEQSHHHSPPNENVQSNASVRRERVSIRNLITL